MFQFQELKASEGSTEKTRGQPAPPYPEVEGQCYSLLPAGRGLHLVGGAQVEVESKV